MHPARGRSAFTLVEIIVVIAVIVILLVAGIGLLGGTGAQARRTGCDMLSGMIDQARTTAITNRSHVVLAIAEPGDLPADDGRCRIGLFKIPEWPDNDSGPLAAVLMSRWRMLENGVVLIGGGTEGLDNPLDQTQLQITYGNGANRRTIQVHAIAFNPRGVLQYPGGSLPMVMRIAEGAYRGGKPALNRRGDSQIIAENRLKIGRVTGRSYRLD